MMGMIQEQYSFKKGMRESVHLKECGKQFISNRTYQDGSWENQDFLSMSRCIEGYFEWPSTKVNITFLVRLPLNAAKKY